MRRLARWLVVISAICSVARTARAMNLPSYDLDSLIYLADGIVEGRLESPDTFRITAVLGGPFSPGQSLHVGQMDWYSKSLFAGGSLSPRDKLFAFLQPDRAGFGWDVIGSGLKLASRGKVYGFFQAMNPGGYIVEVPWDWPVQTRGPTVEDFRNPIKARQGIVARWHSRFAAPPGKNDIPWLLALIRERHKLHPGWYFDGDYILGTAEQRLKSIGDLDALLQAMVETNNSFGLGGGFATPEGREFLLQKIGDNSLTPAGRLLCAYALSAAGGVFRSSFNQSATQPWRSPSEADPKNSSYFTRIARLAAGADGADGQLRLALIEAIERQTYAGTMQRDPQIQADLDDAADVLRQLYLAPAITDAVRYQIEKTMVEIGSHSYDSLNSRCGPLLSLSEPADPNQYGALPPRTICVTYSAIWLQVPADLSGLKAELVLQPLDRGAPTVLPSSMIGVSNVTIRSNSGGTDFISLPKNFRPGRYHVFYRFTAANHVISEGHGFVAALPQAVQLQQGAAWVVPWSSRHREMINRCVNVALVLLLVGAILRLALMVVRCTRQQARIRRKLCPFCAYDLRASGPRCTECGALRGTAAGWPLLRRKFASVISMALICVCAGSAIGWVRSLYATDCVTLGRRHLNVAFYDTRGSFVVEVPAADVGSGWGYEHGLPGEFPRSAAEAGASMTGLRLLGIEVSPDANLVVVPMWVVIGAAGAMVVRLYRSRMKNQSGAVPTESSSSSGSLSPNPPRKRGG